MAQPFNYIGFNVQSKPYNITWSTTITLGVDSGKSPFVAYGFDTRGIQTDTAFGSTSDNTIDGMYGVGCSELVLLRLIYRTDNGNAKVHIKFECAAGDVANNFWGSPATLTIGSSTYNSDNMSFNNANKGFHWVVNSNPLGSTTADDTVVCSIAANNAM